MPTYSKDNVAYRTVQVQRLKGANQPPSDFGLDRVSDMTRRVCQPNPNWRVKVVRRQSASTDYFRSAWEFKSGSFHGHASTPNARGLPGGDPLVDAGGGKMGFHYHPLTSSFPGNRVDPYLKDIAVSRIRSKLAAHSKSMNVVVPLVELRELRGLVRGVAQLSTSMLTTLIDIKRTRGRSALKWASDAWLAFQFGAKPLVSDVAAAAESIASYLAARDHTVRLEASSPTVTRLVSSFRESYPSYFGTNHREVLQGVSRLSYRVVAGFHCPVSSGNNYRLDSQFGLDFQALPSVLWELTPYSWVVDYFTNVGEFLEDTFTVPSGDTLYVSVGRRFEFDYTVTTQLTPYVAVPPAQPVRINYMATAGKGRYIEFQRVAEPNLSRPSLRFRSVDEIGRSGIFKVLNLASVLAGRRANYSLG